MGKIYCMFRPAHEGDMNYVLGSWVAASKHTPRARITPWPLHSARQNKIIEGLLDRGAEVLIAADPHDSNLIYGWICYERFTGDDRQTTTAIHWINLKRHYRGMGLAKLMIRRIGVDILQDILISDSSYIIDIIRRKHGDEKFRFVLIPGLLEGLF